MFVECGERARRAKASFTKPGNPSSAPVHTEEKERVDAFKWPSDLHTLGEACVCAKCNKNF